MPDTINPAIIETIISQPIWKKLYQNTNHTFFSNKTISNITQNTLKNKQIHYFTDDSKDLYKATILPEIILLSNPNSYLSTFDNCNSKLSKLKLFILVLNTENPTKNEFIEQKIRIFLNNIGLTLFQKNTTNGFFYMFWINLNFYPILKTKFTLRNILQNKSLIKKQNKSLIKDSNLFHGCKIIGNTNNVKIDKYVTIGKGTTIFAEHEVSIGAYTMISINVIIHTCTHDYNTHPMWLYRIDRPIKIGAHVWIGAGAIILPGVIIEDYAVIGSGSIVTANIPKGAIVVGNPARIIKYRDKTNYLKEPEISDTFDTIVKKDGFLTKTAKPFKQ